MRPLSQITRVQVQASFRIFLHRAVNGYRELAGVARLPSSMDATRLRRNNSLSSESLGGDAQGYSGRTAGSKPARAGAPSSVSS